jgi:hypothetical protein
MKRRARVLPRRFKSCEGKEARILVCVEKVTLGDAFVYSSLLNKPKGSLQSWNVKYNVTILMKAMQVPSAPSSLTVFFSFDCESLVLSKWCVIVFFSDLV